MNADWASKKVEKVGEGMKCFCLDCTTHFYARLLRQEHQRAVRVVEKVGDARLKDYTGTGTMGELAAYQQAVSDILAALQRGRHKLKEGRT